MSNTFGKILGQPKIKVGFGSFIGKIQRDIRQRTRKGGLKSRRAQIKRFGYGK